MLRTAVKKRKHSVEFLFPIVLFLVFAVSAISVILFAARVYKKEVGNAQANYDTRTSLEYLTQKVHRNDISGSVYTASFGDIPALVLADAASDGAYRTYIYCLDGSLMELYTKEGAAVDPYAGTRILPLLDFKAEKAGDRLLRLTCTDADGKTQSALIALRSGK